MARPDTSHCTPHPGDGSCERCGAVPAVALPTVLCDECSDGVKRAEIAEMLLRSWLAWEDLDRGSEDAGDVAKIRRHLIDDTSRALLPPPATGRRSQR